MKPVLTSLILVMLCITASAQTFPRVYKDGYFNGGSMPLDVSSCNLHSSGFGDNISSCTVPEGWTIVLYQHSNSSGATYTIKGPYSMRSFHDEGWGDCISSVAVFYNGRLLGSSTCAQRKPTREEEYKKKRELYGHPKS